MRTRIISRSVAALACAAALAGTAGCDDDSDSGANATAEALVAARNANDGQAFCDLLSDEAREAIESETEDCAAYVEEQSSGSPTRFELVGVDEEGDKAVATLKAVREEGGSTREAELQIGLERQDGEWRVAALAPPSA